MVSRYAEGIKDVPGLDVEAAVAKIERMVEERVREGEDPGFFASTASSTDGSVIGTIMGERSVNCTLIL